MTLINFLKERLLPSLKQEDDALAYWREWILFAMLACGFAVFPLVLPSVIALILKERLWLLAIINAALLVGMAYLLFSRKLSYRFRACGTLLVVYAASLGILTNAGIVSGAPAWLFGFAVLAALLLGLKGACVATVINVATLSLFWYLTRQGMIGAQFQFFELCG